MRLKRITLQGYKTFANHTAFSFEDGITAIVGPNGSGKSNIADALRWVLGEQSYRTLRGRRSVDMIFAGSQSRSRSGMAQAILTLDNTDGWLPIDFTEVEIGRRVYRSGENDYLLNGQRVRLRDLQELLATSGLAERTYTIVGQGLIDQALSLRSEERRALFEEAAGISHYKSRRAQTLRHLEQTQHNLERIHDILSEINPRLGSLKRQAKRAQDYDQVATDLRHLLRIWYGYNWEHSKQLLKAQRQVAEEAELAWSESRQHLIEEQTRIDQLRREILHFQKQINERQANRDRLKEQLTQVQRQVAVLSERRLLLQQQLAELMQEIPQIGQQWQAAQQELVKATAELEEAQANLQQEQDSLKRFNAGFAAQQQEIDQMSAAVVRLSQQSREAQKQAAQAEGKLGQIQERLQETPAGEELSQEMARASEKMAGLTAVVQTVESRVGELNVQRENLQKREAAIAQSLKQSRQESGELNKKINQVGKEIARLEARREMLDGLRQQEMPLADDLPLVGRLAGLMTIPAEYQTAIAAALGARLGMLIFPDEKALWQLISLDQGDKAFVAVAQQNGADLPTPPPEAIPAGAIEWALNLIALDARIHSLAPVVFGGVLLAAKKKDAYRLAKRLPAGMLVVALDGFVVHAGGVVEFQPQNSQHNILEREEAWRRAGAAQEESQQRLDRLQPRAEALLQEIQVGQAALDELKDEERRLSALIGKETTMMQRGHRERDQAQQQQGFLRRQQERNQAERQKLERQISETQLALAQKKEESNQLIEELKAAENKLQAMPVAESKQQRQDRQQKIDTARTILAGREAVVQSRRATFQQIERQLRRQEARREDLRLQLNRSELESEQERAIKLQADLESLDAELVPLRLSLEERGAKLAQAEDKLSKLQRQVHDRETRYTQGKIALSQRENQLEALSERIYADLGLVDLTYDAEQSGQSPLPIAEVVDKLPQVDELPDDIEKSVLRYRGQLQRMGSVNPEAPGEYAATKERAEFLTQQVADLNQTERQLREVISELDDLTSTAFAETVGVVDGIFSDMFSRLFGGGSARLVLTDPEDLTISGVEILARLPKRRQQGLALLSGGERALTAAALIFALLQVNPPPFCVMDETDAMLDESNVTRFREVLCELGEKTQVIVITHNRGTVQAAQTVYGISMTGDSTSQVISIRPEEYLSQ